MPPEITCEHCGETFYEIDVEDWKDVPGMTSYVSYYQVQYPKCPHCGRWNERKNQ